jgi:hypothetical protein
MPSSLTRLSLLAAALSFPLAVAHAQQPTAAAAKPTFHQTTPLFTGTPSLFSPTSVAAASFASDSSSLYSSSTGEVETAMAEDYLSFDGAQPPPSSRRRYRRPNYSDKMHNKDGSNKLAFMAGAGFTIPAGSDASNYLNTSYDFGVGAGYNWNKKFGMLVQFNWDNFGVPGSVINNQISLYDNAGFTEVNSDGTTSQADFTGLDAHTHIWSFTLNPTFNFYTSDTFGAYAVVGGGFYHKVTTFTVPVEAEGYDYYYGPYIYTANENFDEYTSNSAGVNGGLGITYKPGRFSSERLFAEVRYVHTFNEYRPSDLSVVTSNTTNFYPANSLSTGYMPITFGIRF